MLSIKENTAGQISPVSPPHVTKVALRINSSVPLINKENNVLSKNSQLPGLINWTTKPIFNTRVIRSF